MKKQFMIENIFNSIKNKLIPDPDEIESPFISQIQEIQIKNNFNSCLRNNEIDTGIKDDLISLNKHQGLSTIYSCQGHPPEQKHSYLALTFTEDFCFFITEALDHLKYVNSEIEIEWNSCVYMNKHEQIPCVIIRGYEDFSYFKILRDYFEAKETREL